MTRHVDFPLTCNGHHIGGVLFDISRFDGIVGGELYGKESRELTGTELRFWIELIGEGEILSRSGSMPEDPCSIAKRQRELAMEREAADEQFLFVASDA